jgi:maleylacetate reductase
MTPFVFDARLPRVIFGVDALAQLPGEVDRLGAKRALVLSSHGHEGAAHDVSRRIGQRCVGVFAEALMHVPAELAARACEHARAVAADCVICIGGGSTTGLGKAIALETGIAMIAIPTTYAGSEMTPIYGITEAGVKRTGRDSRVLPRTVLYDPALTLTMPASLSASSGMNAVAHGVEALYAPDANPIMSLMAEEGIGALARALPTVVANPLELTARGECLYGAWLCGAVLGNIGMALHHKLCHTLGGAFNLPHAQTHAVVLPHAVAYNQDAAQQALARVARALGAADKGAARGLYDLAKSLGAPLSLRSIGMLENGLDRAAELATMAPYPTPRALVRAAIRALLQDAFEGTRPRS